MIKESQKQKIMIKRDQIESILKINGVAPSSPDEQIRLVLLSARYSKDEVDTCYYGLT